jgi:predicted anti-sigma-YlaC factor YlaD
MNCEEFANLHLDLDPSAEGLESRAAREHQRDCPACTSLYESSQRLRVELRELGMTTSDAATPSRVEMRLRQEFRTRHKTQKNRGRAIAASWLLAAATIVLVAGSLFIWWHPKDVNVARVRPAVTPEAVQTVAAGPELGGTLIAENDDEAFALIPGALPGLQDETTVVRVQMQRGALSALGLTVNEEHANDVVQVDLLVGADGQPQAYRLPQQISN